MGLGDMEEYVALESAATVIKAWQLSFVPGLLQTPGYMRALRLDEPSAVFSDHDERFVTARLARQRRLGEEPFLTLRAVIHESALRNAIGGPEVMRDQLKYLSTAAGKANITVQVVPLSAGARHGMDCAFNIISFAEPGSMDVVYMEVPFTRIWIEGGDGAVQHGELFEIIAGQALSEGDSRRLIDSFAEGS